MLFLMGPADGQSPVGIMDLLMPFFLVFFIMWLLVIRPQRKEQKRREAMLSGIKKGDVVVTSSGIIGKIVKFKSDDQIEVKVDESNDTKITFLKSAIVTAISRDDKEAAEGKEAPAEPSKEKQKKKRK